MSKSSSTSAEWTHATTPCATKKMNATGKNITEEWIDQKNFDNLTDAQKALHVGIREKINHPNISGPFETGWGYTDFNGSGLMDKIGLPTLPGQLISLKR